jgi:5'-deoxynucleotidase YfbR-like HD superfamily hydrolase
MSEQGLKNRLRALALRKLLEYHSKLSSYEYSGSDAWIQTFSGKSYHFLDPRQDEISIEDIAHALSNQCRFSGHCRKFYSVAQHSVLCSEVVPIEYAFQALMHDAPEAYVVDLPRPIKRCGALLGYDKLEDISWRAVCRKFSLATELHQSVKIADTRMLMTEQRDIMGKQARVTADVNPYYRKIVPVAPEEAEAMFLDRYRELVQRNYELMTQKLWEQQRVKHHAH